VFKNNRLDNVQLDLLERNTIYIGGEVDVDMIVYVREAILRLTAKGSPDITLLITSEGGSVDIGLDIYDILEGYSGKKTAIVFGYAHSMAAIILQACQKRIAKRHARILLHHISKTQISLDALRDQKKTKDIRAELEKSQKLLYKILVDRTKHSVEEIKAVCAKDQSMSANEALAFGLIDEIR
jgi:ATP-dependent Clp protease protease subunit